MAEQPEYVKVERPLIEQLEAMGWEHLRGAPPGQPAARPEDSGRRSFTDVVYADRFRNAVARINVRPEDGTSWLTAQQLDHILARVRGTAPGQGAAGRAGRHRELRSHPAAARGHSRPHDPRLDQRRP